MKTKAMVFREANKPLIEELELPKLTADDVLVRADYTGVSIGTEQSIFSGVRTCNGTFPLVGGYMASGVVEEAGKNVKAFKPGDRVISPGTRLDKDVNSVWGGHSSRQVTAAENCLLLPERTDPKAAALYVMPGVGINAANQAGICMEDTVLIQGQGLIGQLYGQWCTGRGARVITIEPDPARQELSRRLVTPHVIDPLHEDVAARVNELTQGAGPSVVVEATASARLIKNITPYLRPGSKMIFLSWYPDQISIEFAHFHNNQIKAFFPCGNGGPEAARATLTALAQGRIRMEENITDVYPYTQACEGYQRIIDGDRTIMAMVVDWTDT